jgi:hypothetical protein
LKGVRRLKRKRPKWTTKADYKFVNIFGESWFAKIDSAGLVTVTSNDDLIAWEEKTLDPRVTLARSGELNTVARAFGANEKLAADLVSGPWVMSEAERTWLKSVLMVASEKQEASKCKKARGDRQRKNTRL